MSTEAMRKALEALEKFAAWTKAENNHAGTTFGQRIEMMREADAARDEAIPLLRAALAAPEPGAWRPIETAPAEPVSLQRCNCPNIGYCDGSCAPYIGGPDEDTGAAVIAAASQWWCEREVTDWDSADLAKAIIRHEGDWLGCPDCDHSTCDEPCTPATVAEQLRGVDCQVAQLVHDGKLYAPEGYAPPDGWKPVEVRRKRADEPANWRMRIAAIAAECSDMDTTDALDELLEETPAEPAPVRVAMTLAGYFINTGSPGQPRWREVDRSYRTNGAVVRLYRSDDHYGIPDTNTTGDAA